MKSQVSGKEKAATTRGWLSLLDVDEEEEVDDRDDLIFTFG